MAKLVLTAVGILGLVVVPIGAFLLGLATGRPYLRLLLAKPAVLLQFFLATFVIMPVLANTLGFFKLVPWPVWAGLALISIVPPGAGLSEKVEKFTQDIWDGKEWEGTGEPLKSLGGCNFRSGHSLVLMALNFRQDLTSSLHFRQCKLPKLGNCAESEAGNF